MADKAPIGEHPQQALYRAEAEQQQKAGKQPAPAPHPAQVMANDLGTETHNLDRDALAEYRAGQTKKPAASAATSASSEKSEG